MRITIDMLGKTSSDVIEFKRPYQYVVAFLVFCFTVLLVFLEVSFIFDSLQREFSTVLAYIYLLGGFVLSYEISGKIMQLASNKKEKDKVKGHRLFLRYFYNSLFAILFLIFSVFIMFFL